MAAEGYIADKLALLKERLDSVDVKPDEKHKLEEATTLLERLKLYGSGRRFEVGDIVKWKAGLVNRRKPEINELCVITRVYPVPFFDSSRKDAGSPYYREPLDVAVGFIDNDGDLLELHYDSRRLCLVDPDECAPRAVKRLKEALERLVAPQPKFKVGDVVRWKEGLVNKGRPRAREPAVVIQTMDPPIYDERRDGGSHLYREPIDLRLAILDDDDEFVIYHFDSRRFEVVPEDQVVPFFVDQFGADGSDDEEDDDDDSDGDDDDSDDDDDEEEFDTDNDDDDGESKEQFGDVD